MIQLMEERLKKIRFANNQSLTSIGVFVKGISKSKTHQVSRDRLVCAITIKLDGRNAKSRVQFKYILQNGKGDEIFETLQ